MSTIQHFCMSSESQMANNEPLQLTLSVVTKPCDTRTFIEVPRTGSILCEKCVPETENIQHIIVALLIHYITQALWEVRFEVNIFRNMGKTDRDGRIIETQYEEERNRLRLSFTSNKLIN